MIEDRWTVGPGALPAVKTTQEMAHEIIMRGMCRAAGLDYEAEVAVIRERDAAGLCRECGERQRRIGHFCVECHARQAAVAETERQAAELASYRERAATFRADCAKRGIVVGATVQRRRGGATGRVVEVGGHYVRVAWLPFGTVHYPGFRMTGRERRTYTRDPQSLVVTP